MSTELKDLLQEQAKAFEDFKDANDQRIEAIEAKGYAPADLEEKVGKIEADLQRVSDDAKEAMKNASKIPTGGDGQKSEEEIEYAAKLETYMRTGRDEGLADLQSKLQHSGALITTSDPDGGYLILPELDSMIDRVVPTISAIGRLSKQVSLTKTSKWQKIVKTSGLTMRRIQEGSGGGETDNPNYGQIEIEAFNAEVEPWITNNMLEDVPMLANDLAEEAAIGFGEGLGLEFITGTGVNQARGITGYTAVANASYSWGNLGYIAAGAAGAFTSSAPGDKIVDLQHALKQQYRPGAAFLMSDATLASVRQMKDGSGAYYLWQPDPLVGFGGRLLGSPVEIDDNMPAIAANSLSIAYGNFARGYAVVTRRGTTLIRDNLTTKGKTKFNFTRRVGGGVYNFEAIKLMKFAAS